MFKLFLKLFGIKKSIRDAGMNYTSGKIESPKPEKTTGERIQNFAVFLFIFLIVVSMVVAIVLWVEIEDGEPFYVLGGFLVAIFGLLSAWCAYLALSGFGILVENSEKNSVFYKSIKQSIKNIESKMDQLTLEMDCDAPQENEEIMSEECDATEQAEAPQKSEEWFCSECGTKNRVGAAFCKECGKAK